MNTVRREGGWNLVELMVVVALLGTVAGTLLGVATTIRRDERHMHACATDLTTLRRAVRQIEADVRAGADLDALGYALEGGHLARGPRVLARNVARFDVVREGDVTRVSLALGPRTDAPHRREAALDIVVARRTGGAR